MGRWLGWKEGGRKVRERDTKLLKLLHADKQLQVGLGGGEWGKTGSSREETGVIKPGTPGAAEDIMSPCSPFNEHRRLICLVNVLMGSL